MGDAEKIDERFHYFFIHNVFGHFFHDSLDYFSSYLYPRFEWTVVATYDKAVEYIMKTEQLNREADVPNFPALILNPSGEFTLDDANTTARQLWRFPNLAPGMIKSIYDPIYQDSRMLVTTGFTRIKGEIELIMLTNSFYEYCDLRVFLIQIFGGFERYITPLYFNSFIILPEELLNYTYVNEVEGINYSIDWENNQANSELILSTAKTELVYPCKIKPRYRMMNISDGSERYGGTDNVADWRLNITLEYEVEMPSYIILESDYLVENISVTIGYSSAFSENYGFIPKEVDSFESSYDTKLVEEENSEPEFPDEADIVDRNNLILSNRYFHQITQTEIDSTSNIKITMPEQVIDFNYLIVNCKSGQLTYGIDEEGGHYTLKDDGNTLVIFKNNVYFEVDEILELYIYKDNT